ncbi:MAG: NmrA family NAD(P)-binding protein [Chloroflexi bacterium]|nr:NmrA family NAD(P)-binding protein [Chloroflexota bacterium]
MLIGGLGIGLFPPNNSVWLASVTPSLLRGRAVGGMTSALFLGQFFSPIITQPLIQQIGIANTFATAGAASILVAALFAATVMKRSKKPKEIYKIILVTGATGQQGGATARHLLRNGWSVRGLTRNSNSPAAQALAEIGVKVVQGDLDDRASLDSVLDGVYGVFSFPNMASGIEGEVRQGKIVADAAKVAGVEHFVQGSVGGVERQSGVPHFESKWQIEEYVRSLNLPATFLRPVFFMNNFNWNRETIFEGTFSTMGLDTDKALQLIAVDDIGAFAALAFENPQEYIGQGLEVAGDELTESQMVKIMSNVIGRQVDLVSSAGAALNEDMAKMYAWFNEEGYEADIPALRNQYPDLMNLESWLRENGWAS